MVDHHHWQLDGSAPELYQRYLVPAITTKWAEDLVGRAQPQAGEDVLDVACGTGVVARLASKRIVQGHVTGLDRLIGSREVRSICHSRQENLIWFFASWACSSSQIRGVPSARCDVCCRLRAASPLASTVR